jgi:hypothetical protein
MDPADHPHLSRMLCDRVDIAVVGGVVGVRPGQRAEVAGRAVGDELRVAADLDVAAPGLPGPATGWPGTCWSWRPRSCGLPTAGTARPSVTFPSWLGEHLQPVQLLGGAVILARGLPSAPRAISTRGALPLPPGPPRPASPGIGGWHERTRRRWTLRRSLGTDSYGAGAGRGRGLLLARRVRPRGLPLACIGGAIVAAEELGRSGVLPWPGGLLWPVVAGLALIAAGIGLRAWPITVLGHFFQYRIMC